MLMPGPEAKSRRRWLSWWNLVFLLVSVLRWFPLLNLNALVFFFLGSYFILCYNLFLLIKSSYIPCWFIRTAVEFILPCILNDGPLSCPLTLYLLSHLLTFFVCLFPSTIFFYVVFCIKRYCWIDATFSTRM